MRTCQSCGAENPPDRDFCSCGEYLRWEPTGYMQAITPDMAAEAASVSAEAAAQVAPPPPPDPAPPPPAPGGAHVTPAAPVAPDSGGSHGNGHGQPAPPPPPPPAPTAAPVPAVTRQPATPAQPVAKTLVRGAVPAQPPAAAPPQQHEPATIVLRLPDGEHAKGETLHQAVEPGQRDRVLALIRNQSGIVDNYDLRVEGLPQDWWSIYPSTVYLVPFGSGGTYEQEVEIHLHPPRGPEAEARVWDLQVVADSKAHLNVAATAPLALHIAPYIETVTSLRPQRKKGRRKADFDITVLNKANAPVLVALDGEDPDGELQFGFNRPPQEIPAGAAVTSQMRVKPPKQIWIGRGQDRRLEVKTVTGEEAAARAAAEPLGAEVLAHAGPPVKKRWWKRSQPQVPGVYGPRVYKPQLYPPDVNIGPGGLQVRMPQLRAPQIQGPQMKSVQASQFKGNLKLPGQGGQSAPAAPLLPTQGVFRQKAWLPWWLLPLLALLLLLLLFLYMQLPKNVAVPGVVGEKSAFTAEKKLTEAELKLDPNQKTEVKEDVEPGTVIAQTPEEGTEVEKGSPVTVLVAIGTGNVNVPKIVGLTAAEAEKALREKQLTLGQASPQPVDPDGKISSQIPAENEVVKRGTPVDIFYPDPSDAEAKKKKADKDKEGGAGAAGGAGGAGGGGEGAKDIVVPAIGEDDVDAYAKKAADLGIVPEVSKEFNDAKPGVLFATEPPGGTKVATGAKVKLLVSLGQPQVVFTNGKNILRVDGANGAKFDPVAATSQDEEDPTWNAVGTHVAYTSNLRVMLKDITKKDQKAVPLTPAGEKYENLAWAPSADINLIAMNDVGANTDPDDGDLCLAHVKKDGTDVGCKKEPSFTIIRALRWSPDGRQIVGTGVKLPTGQGIFGTVRWTVKKDKPAFSPDIADWNSGKFVTDIETPGKGVLDTAFSPDGKRLAMVSNQGSSFFKLWFAEEGDFLMTSATPTSTRACKVTWRGDGKEVLLVQGDAECREDVSPLVRAGTDNVRTSEELNALGDDPAYQPPAVGK